MFGRRIHSRDVDQFLMPSIQFIYYIATKPLDEIRMASGQPLQPFKRRLIISNTSTDRWRLHYLFALRRAEKADFFGHGNIENPAPHSVIEIFCRACADKDKTGVAAHHP